MLAAIGVGLLAGLLSVAYRLAVARAETYSHAYANTLAGAGVLGVLAVGLCGAILGGSAGFLTERFAPEAGGSGIPHIKASLMNLRTIRPLVLLPVKFVAGWLALASGMSLGREGPTIQMGAAAGKLLSNLFRVPRRSHGMMVAAGSGAGLAGAFNAPLAGFIFVMEELKLAMTPLTYGVALFACVGSVAVTRIFLGQIPSFRLSNPDPVPLRAMGAVLVLGAVCGVVGVVYNRALLGFLNLREKLKLKRWMAGAIVGCLASLLILVLPDATGGGNGVAAKILTGEFAAQATLGYVAFLLVAKLLATAAGYGTGVPGGIFAPILVIGALTGFGVGTVGSTLFPQLGISPAVFATIGMAGVLSASVRAPLTGVVLIVEMTGEYNLLYALLVGAFLAYGIPDLLRDPPIYEALMERDLHGTAGAQEFEEPVELELSVEQDSFMDGRALKDLHLPGTVLVVGIRRDRQTIVPTGLTRLMSGDVVRVHVEGENAESTAIAIHDAAKAP
jgi:CIC family chloride channel protein